MQVLEFNGFQSLYLGALHSKDQNSVQLPGRIQLFCLCTAQKYRSSACSQVKTHGSSS